MYRMPFVTWTTSTVLSLSLSLSLPVSVSKDNKITYQNERTSQMCMGGLCHLVNPQRYSQWNHNGYVDWNILFCIEGRSSRWLEMKTAFWIPRFLLLRLLILQGLVSIQTIIGRHRMWWEDTIGRGFIESRANNGEKKGPSYWLSPPLTYD